MVQTKAVILMHFIVHEHSVFSLLALCIYLSSSKVQYEWHSANTRSLTSCTHNAVKPPCYDRQPGNLYSISVPALSPENLASSDASSTYVKTSVTGG